MVGNESDLMGNAEAPSKISEKKHVDLGNDTHDSSILNKKIFKSISWLATFKFISQMISWAITIAIARILIPSDYGIMSMSTIITGYVEMFSELGMGAAIIQRKLISPLELTTVFWMSFVVSVFLAIMCFPCSYLTAHLMNEPRVIPLTQAVSIIFILSSLCIIPSNILRRSLDFKSLGLIELISTFVSVIGMLWIAKIGGGPWALISGRIIRVFVNAVLLFYKVPWRPSFYFNLNDAKSFLKFGSYLAVARSLFYVQEKSDTFFAGRAWTSSVLGLYGFALQLAHIPTEKITSLINQVTFPAFSKLQDNKGAFNNLYLNVSKVTMFIVLPLFLGGFVTGDLIIKIFLNEKWYSMIELFRFFCIAQIFISLNAINSFVHSSQDRPQWSLYYNIISVIVMPISFYLSVPFGMNAMAYPWLIVFPILCSSWTIITLLKIGIRLADYCKILMHPLCGSICMSIGIYFVMRSLKTMDYLPNAIMLMLYLLIGISIYFGYNMIFDRKFLYVIKGYFRPGPEKVNNISTN